MNIRKILCWLGYHKFVPMGRWTDRAYFYPRFGCQHCLEDRPLTFEEMAVVQNEKTLERLKKEKL